MSFANIFRICIWAFLWMSNIGSSQSLSELLISVQGQLFQNFKTKYSKIYPTDSQELYRNLIVFQNAYKIASHNLNPNKSYAMAMNSFSDLTEKQFKLKYSFFMPSTKQIRDLAVQIQRKQQLQKDTCSCRSDFQSIRKELTQLDTSLNKSLKQLNTTFTAAKNNKLKEQIQFSTVINDLKSYTSYLSPQEIQVTENKIKNGGGSLRLNNDISRGTAKIAPTDGVLGNLQKVSSAESQVSYSLTSQTILNALGDQDLIIGIIQVSKTTTTKPLYLTTNSPPSQITVLSTKSISPNNTIEIDWSKHTGPVRTQGKCGACYAIAAIANLQALLSMFTFGFNVQLSIQQVIDCDTSGLTFGCNGGYFQGAYIYMKNKGVTTQFSYPFLSPSTGTPSACKNLTGTWKVSSFKNLPFGGCTQLKTQLAKKPVSIGIASARLQFYSSGTFNNCTTTIDHAVLLVGFSSNKGWKIKNSWGSSWGESGYGWIQDGNNCGVCNMATVPKIAGEPA